MLAEDNFDEVWGVDQHSPHVGAETLPALVPRVGQG